MNEDKKKYTVNRREFIDFLVGHGLATVNLRPDGRLILWLQRDRLEENKKRDYFEKILEQMHTFFNYADKSVHPYDLPQVADLLRDAVDKVLLYFVIDETLKHDYIDLQRPDDKSVIKLWQKLESLKIGRIKWGVTGISAGIQFNEGMTSHLVQSRGTEHVIRLITEDESDYQYIRLLLNHIINGWTTYLIERFPSKYIEASKKHFA